MKVSFAELTIGGKYTRDDLAKLWGYAGSEALSRGVVTPRDDNKIILFVTLDKHPDAEPYRDELVGSVLNWEGPNDHFAEDRMVAHGEAAEEVHLFCRAKPRERFTYAGSLTLDSCERLLDRPSRFVFRLRQEMGR